MCTHTCELQALLRPHSVQLWRGEWTARKGAGEKPALNPLYQGPLLCGEDPFFYVSQESGSVENCCAAPDDPCCHFVGDRRS